MPDHQPGAELAASAPLAIRWSIGQIKQRGQSIDGVLDSLYDARGDIFEFIFERAWSLLSESAIQILTVMPIFAASASKAAIEAASDVHKYDLSEGLGQLVELWLLEASDRLDASKRRYNLHPLTRAYAQKRLAEQADLERQARVRLVDYFESFAKKRGGDQWAWERYDEIEEEKDNIFALIEWCFASDEGLYGMKLTRSVTYFMGMRGFFIEMKIFGEKAIEAARKESKEDFAWLLIHGLSWYYLQTKDSGYVKKGEALVREGLEICEALNDSKGIRSAMRNLGLALRYQGKYYDAKACFERGLELANAVGNERAVIRFRKELAMLYTSEGKYAEAKKNLKSILPYLKRNDKMTLVSTLGNLSQVNRMLKNYNDAYKYGTEGLQLAMKMKRRFTVAWISLVLAYNEFERCNYKSALSFAQQSLEFYEKAGSFQRQKKKIKSLIKELEEKLAE